MKKIDIKKDNSIFHINIYDGSYDCSHNEFEISLPCCSSKGESGYIECACGGFAEVACNSLDCTGINDDDANILFEKAFGGGDECSV